MGGGTRSHNPVSIAILSKQTADIKFVLHAFVQKSTTGAYVIQNYLSSDKMQPVFFESVTAKNTVQLLEAGAVYGLIVVLCSLVAT